MPHSFRTAIRPFTLAPVLCAASVLAAPALGQALVDATKLDKIVEIARGYGDAVLDVDSLGDPMVSATLGKTNYAVFFYGCTDGADCTTIQFRARYTGLEDIDAERLNTWNAEKRFGKAYIDSEGDTSFEMDVNLWSGVHENNLNDTFDWWRVMTEGFEEYIGFEHADEPATAATDTPVTREADADTPPTTVGNPTAQGVGTGTLGGGSKVKLKR